MIYRFSIKLYLKIGDNQYPKARTSRDLRSSFISKKKAIESYTIIESWNPDKIIFSHGRIILENGSEKLKRSILLVEKIIRMIVYSIQENWYFGRNMDSKQWEQLLIYSLYETILRKCGECDVISKYYWNKYFERY